jgi:signal transduction histidine kinase
VGPVSGDDPRGARPLPWVAWLLYGAVLVTGVTYDAAGLSGPDRSPVAGMAFVALLGALFALEAVDWRRPGPASRRPAIALLGLRMVLIELVNAVDGAGLARALYLLVPFFAYFLLGRRVSVALAGLYLAAAVARASTVSGWYRSPELVSDLLMFGIGLVFAVSMAAVAVEAQASRAAYAGQAADLAAASERNRLARDIHDSLGHHLTAIAVQLDKAAAYRDLDPAAADLAVADARRSASAALADVRRSVGALRAGDEAFSLAAAVAALADGVRDGDLAVTVDVTGEEAGYDRAALTALYRAAQEGLTNARRHAAAGRVAVTVALGEREARLVVADDGRGFPGDATSESPAGGYGLRGMRERLEPLGAAGRQPGDRRRARRRHPADRAGAPVGDGPGGAVTGDDRPVRVLVVDDQRLIREGISSLLDLQPGVEVC